MSREYADPNCTVCGGAGFVYPASLFTRPGEKGGRFCDCAMDSMRLVNMNRVWPSLSTAQEFPKLRDDAPLRHFVGRDLWLTATIPVFRAHLKAVAYTRPVLWDCRVYPDAELITSWLGTAKAEGIRIYDLDAEKSTLEAIDLRDLVEPPDLVILLLGVKQLPNKEAPNALLEAIQYRRHAGKPLWLVDQPDHRIDHVHHRFYSETLEMWLAHWAHFQLAGRSMRKMTGSSTSSEPVADAGHVDEILETKIEDALSDLSPESTDETPSTSTATRSTAARGTRDLSHKLKTEEASKPKRPPSGRGKPK